MAKALILRVLGAFAGWVGLLFHVRLFGFGEFECGSDDRS